MIPTAEAPFCAKLPDSPMYTKKDKSGLTQYQKTILFNFSQAMDNFRQKCT